MARIEAVLFDKDGTLFDFNATWGVWTRSLLSEESGGDPDRMAEMAHVLGYDVAGGLFLPDSLVIGGTVEEVARAILPFLPGQTLSEVVVRFNAKAASAPQVEAVPLVPFLLGLSARGLALGVATNDAEMPARAHLSAAGVEHSFDFIAGYDSGFGGKPEAGQLLGFAGAVGVAPESCAMVGDSLHDLKAARAAGFVSVGVLTGLASFDDLAPFADVVFDSIADVPGWLDDQARKPT